MTAINKSTEKLIMNFKPNMLFLNRSFDKKRLKALLLWFRLNLSENAALKAVEILQGLGFHSATQGAISLGLDDLKTPKSKGGRVFQAQVEVALAHHEHHRGNRTPVELFQHLVDTWHRTSQDLTTEVVQLFHSTERVNPVYMMAFSGARGNISQVRQLVGMRGLMADPRGQIVGFPILSNFREGLTITEYFVSCYGARKGVVDTAIRTADAGYLTRRLADVSHHVVVRTTNCGTHESILLRDIKEGQKTILSLANRLVGRVLAEHVSLPVDKTNPASNSKILKLTNQKRVCCTNPSKVITGACFASHPNNSIPSAKQSFAKGYGTPSCAREEKLRFTPIPCKGKGYTRKPLYPAKVKSMGLSSLHSEDKTKTIIHRNSEITSSLASKLAAHYLEVPVRSPLSCSLPWGVCQLCYGWGLSEGRRVTLGEAVGIIAAQSIGEPGTQLTLRTFHTGGVFSGELLNEIRAPYNGNVIFPTPLQGLLIRTPHGQIAFLTKVSGKMKVYETFEEILPQHKEPQRGAEISEGTPLPSAKQKGTAENPLPSAKQKGIQSSALQKDTETPYKSSICKELRRKSEGVMLTSCKFQQDSEFFIQPSTVIFIKQKEYVANNQLLAEFSSSTLQSVNDQIEITQQVLSDIAGQIWFKELEYGNRKGPGSGSLGIYFSSQKLGGIWVLAGKPMIDTHSSFASPTCTANLLPQSVNTTPYPFFKPPALLPSAKQKGIKGMRSFFSNGVPRAIATSMGVPHANSIPDLSFTTLTRLSANAQLKSTGVSEGNSLQISDLQKVMLTNCVNEFNEYKVKPLLSFAKESENESLSEANIEDQHTINNFAKSKTHLTNQRFVPFVKSDVLKSFIPLITIVRGKQKLQIENNISSKIIKDIFRYNNLVLSKSPKINDSPLKRKNLFKYHTYGIQNRLKRFLNTRYAKTGKTSLINLQNNYELPAAHTKKICALPLYDYVLGYSQTVSFKKHTAEAPFYHNSKSLLFKHRNLKNNKFIIHAKQQKDLGSRAIYKSFERIENKIKKSILIFQELRSELQRNSDRNSLPSTGFSAVSFTQCEAKGYKGKGVSRRNLLTSYESKFTLRQGKTRGSSKKLDMLPLLDESDLVTFVTNYNDGHNHTQCKPNVGQMLFHPAGIETNSLPLPLAGYELYKSDKSYKSKICRTKLICTICNGWQNKEKLDSLSASSIPDPSVATLTEYKGFLRTRSCEIPYPVKGVRSREYAKQSIQSTQKRVCEAAEVKESMGSKNKKPVGIACKTVAKPCFVIENVISLPSIPVLPPLAPYFNKASFSLSTFLSIQQLKGEKSINNKSMNNSPNSRKVNKSYLSTILMNSNSVNEFFVSQGNKSSYFATEKRRLQSTWIQKKRAYLTFLNQVCSIPFTQQFSKNTNFNSRGYTAGAFTNFIGRTNVQLSTNNFCFASHPSMRITSQRNSLPITPSGYTKQSFAKGLSPNAQLRNNFCASEGNSLQISDLQKVMLKNCANEVGYLFPGQLLTYGDNITNNIVTTESGQVLYIDSQKTTVRKAQTVLIYSQAIIAVLSGDWIKKGTPLMSLSYQKLVTGDIVQGLPKIEQFFEAPVLRDGTFWSDSLQAKLNQFFQEEREKLPLAEAVRKSFSEIQRVLVEGVLRVYISQGVLIADKHLEVIIRQMTCKGRILYSGDTGFLRNELVSLDKIENVNQVTYGQKALYHPQVRGITDASLESESFLSAASFQETTRVLSRDAIIGKTDLMRGLKERVIVGELIQAGTGLANNSVYNLLADCIA